MSNSPHPRRTAQRRRTASQRRLAYINNFLKANAREIYEYGRKGHRLIGRGYVIVFCAQITVASPRCPTTKATAVKGQLGYIPCDDKTLRHLRDAELCERVKNYDARRECIVVAFYNLTYTHTVMSRGRPAGRGH